MKTTTTENNIIVSAPFHPELPAAARKLGGQWDGQVWRFDIRDEERVRGMLVTIYGEDGTTPPERVTLRVTVDPDGWGWGALRSGLFLGGRAVARAWGRDSNAIIEPGVVVIDGPGFNSGGSQKNWRTLAEPGTVFEIRDMTKVGALRAIKNIDDDAPGHNGLRGAQIIDRVDPDHRENLKAERDLLLARLADIDAELDTDTDYSAECALMQEQAM